ncbi:MAG: NYN domain-containing protein [Ktedonobacteraceae bacterium]
MLYNKTKAFRVGAPLACALPGRVGAPLACALPGVETMGHDILVDGYNVIRRNTAFRAAVTKNIGVARDLLVTQLVNRYKHTPHQVVVVFDGDSVSEQVCYDRRVRIIYSRHGETADSVIARLSAEARVLGREVEMYSDDGEVRQAVASQGGAVRTTEQLTAQLNAAPRDVARRSRHRQAMRLRYGLDPNYDPDAEPEPPSRHHKKRKKARH